MLEAEDELERLARMQQRDRRQQKEPPPDNAPPEGLNEWDAGDDTDPPPPREWLLGNAFCRRFLSSLLGDGGVGKAPLRVAQAMALVTGRPLTANSSTSAKLLIPAGRHAEGALPRAGCPYPSRRKRGRTGPALSRALNRGVGAHDAESRGASSKTPAKPGGCHRPSRDRADHPRSVREDAQRSRKSQQRNGLGRAVTE